MRYKMEERQGSWRGEEEKTEDQLIRTSPVLRRSTPVGPGFKARSTPCLRVPLPMLLRFSRFRSFSAPFSSFSLLPHSFFGNLPFSSISRCSLSMRSYTHTPHVYTCMRVHSVTAILSALSGHLLSSQLPLLFSLVRATTSLLATVIHHRSEISGQ